MDGTPALLIHGCGGADDERAEYVRMWERRSVFRKGRERDIRVRAAEVQPTIKANSCPRFLHEGYLLWVEIGTGRSERQVELARGVRIIYVRKRLFTCFVQGIH